MLIYVIVYLITSKSNGLTSFTTICQHKRQSLIGLTEPLDQEKIRPVCAEESLSES